MLVGKRQNIVVTGGQDIFLPGIRRVPDGSHGVDDFPGRQSITRRYDGLPGGTAADAVKIIVDFAAGFSSDRAVNTAARQKRGICRVHNRIDIKVCDVGFDNPDSVRQFQGPFSAQCAMR